MALEPFLVFISNNDTAAVSESRRAFKGKVDPFPTKSALVGANYFPIREWSFGSVQTLNIGSQSSGAGAGKITFNALEVKRPVDAHSETLFLNECAGIAFKYVDLVIVQSGDSGQAGYVAWRFGLCGVKSMTSASDDAGPVETVTFEYGKAGMAYSTRNDKGVWSSPAFTGWDRVRNVRWNPAVY